MRRKNSCASSPPNGGTGEILTKVYGMHINSEEDWVNYIEGRVKPAERLKLETHLEECAECNDLYGRLLRTEMTLKKSGLKAKSDFVITEEEINVGLAKVLARILDSEATAQNLNRDAVQVRLEQLEDILAAMCGSWTAVNALRVAAEGTLAKSPANLTQETWIPFLKKLKSIASVFCGDTGAKLVWEYGQL